MGVDLTILGVMLISAAISMIRGFYSEIVSLLTWLGAIFITLFFTSNFASLLSKDTFESPTARLGISAFILFVGCMLVGGLINFLFQKVLAGSTRTAADRTIGLFFGLTRGAIIITLVVLMTNLVPNIKLETWWRTSRLVPPFQFAARVVHARLPAGIAQHFDFDAPSV